MKNLPCAAINYNLIVFGSQSSSDLQFHVNVCNHVAKPLPKVRYLGVLFDVTLSFDAHIIDLCKSSFCFLRSIYRIRSYLDKATLMLLVNGFVFSRLDYCNALFSYCNDYSLQRLQRVQNCFCRLILHLPRSSPTSLAIKQLGWLRIKDRMIFKLLCLLHKCIYGSSPDYLKQLIAIILFVIFAFSPFS